LMTNEAQLAGFAAAALWASAKWRLRLVGLSQSRCGNAKTLLRTAIVILGHGSSHPESMIVELQQSLMPLNEIKTGLMKSVQRSVWVYGDARIIFAELICNRRSQHPDKQHWQTLFRMTWGPASPSCGDLPSTGFLNFPRSVRFFDHHHDDAPDLHPGAAVRASNRTFNNTCPCAEKLARLLIFVTTS